MGLKRFVDDLTGLWVGSKSEFVSWANSVNSNLNRLGLSIKDNFEDPWDFNSSGVYTTFLDIRFMFNNDGSLSTDINVKETYSRGYLHFSSYHPRQTFPSIIYSQALRYRRIINHSIRLFRRLDELKTCFLNSGYPKKMIDNILDDAVKRPRNLNYKAMDKNPPYQVIWIQTFRPSTKEIRTAVKEANLMLQKCPVWSKDNNPIGIVSRRAKNLGEMILKRKNLALTSSVNPSSGTERCTPIISSRRVRPCASCPLMSNSSTIKSTATGISYNTPLGNCKSRDVVYCAEFLIIDPMLAIIVLILILMKLRWQNISIMIIILIQ